MHSKKTMFKGVAFLAIIGFINKMIGVLFRIPLANLIGDEGIGLYHLVFPSYALLLTLSTAGIPVAISRLISENIALGNIKKTKKIFKISMLTLALMGIVSTLFMVLNFENLAYSVGNIQSLWGFVAIAPALFLVCILSALRGYTQGFHNMVPSGISQLVEQVAKVFFALPLAYIGMKHGVAQAAALALFGTSIAEFLALVYLWIYVARHKKQVSIVKAHDRHVRYDSIAVFKEIIKVSIPVMLGACIVPFSQFVDSAMLVNRMVHTAGLGVREASSLYGLYTGYVITLINVPTAFAIAIASSTVPFISDSKALQNVEEVGMRASNSLRYSCIIGMPSSFGMLILSKEIISFFYSSLGSEKILITSRLLVISSITIILFILVQSTTAILQGLGKERIPTYTLIIAVAVKIAINFVLTGDPNINIFGAPIASIFCYLVSLVPNLYYVKKHCKTSLNLFSTIFKTALAALLMTIVIVIAERMLQAGRLSTIILLALGIASYCLFALKLKLLLPGELEALYRRFKR